MSTDSAIDRLVNDTNLSPALRRALAKQQTQYGNGWVARILRGEKVAANPATPIVGETETQYANRMRAQCFVPAVSVRKGD